MSRRLPAVLSAACDPPRPFCRVDRAAMSDAASYAHTAAQGLMGARLAMRDFRDARRTQDPDAAMYRLMEGPYPSVGRTR